MSELSKAVDVLKSMQEEYVFKILTFTANLIATGVRGIIKELCKKRYFDLIITTPGALEHDIMRVLGPYYVGSFDLNDVELHDKGLNRIGNVLVPTKRYEDFEKFFSKAVSTFDEQISPMELARRMGKVINSEDSFLYWCYKNDIPVFCPGIVDGAIGLNLYFIRKKKKVELAILDDMDKLAQWILDSDETGALIIGGGISKHFTIGMNLLRGGLDYAVYITTAVEWDGSLSGARTREAQSWGKIKERAKHVIVYGEATTLLPILYANAFL
jgi:deoxyhypusine synthase